MKKNAILFETSDEGKIAIVVPNFSKENVIEAISYDLLIKKENIIQLSASISYGLYAIKNDCFTSNLVPILESEYKDTEHSFIFEIHYIKVIY